MLTFFTHLMIITGGVICVLFWIAVIIAALIELIDALSPKDKKPSYTEDYDVDLDVER